MLRKYKSGASKRKTADKAKEAISKITRLSSFFSSEPLVPSEVVDGELVPERSNISDSCEENSDFEQLELSSQSLNNTEVGSVVGATRLSSRQNFDLV